MAHGGATMDSNPEIRVRVRVQRARGAAPLANPDVCANLVESERWGAAPVSRGARGATLAPVQPTRARADIPPLLLVAWPRPVGPQSRAVKGYLYLRVAQAAGVVFLAVQYQPALIEAAERVADADGTLWGCLKYDSVIPGVLMAAGIMSAVLSPAVGVVCDFTSLRKPLLLGAAFLQFVSTIAAVCLAPTHGGVGGGLACLFVFNVCYSLLLTGQSSWLPELTDDQEHLATINRRAYSLLYITEVAFVVLNVGLVLALSLDYLWQGRAAALVCGTSGLVFVALAWRKLEKREPSHQLPEGTKSLFGFSFRRVVSLTRMLREDYEDFYWFLAHLLLTDPAQNAIVTLGSAFLKSELNFKASQVSQIFGLAIISAAAGSYLGSGLGRKIGIKRAVQLLLCTLGVFTVFGASLLPRCTTVSVPDAAPPPGAALPPPPPPFEDDDEGCDATFGDLVPPLVISIVWGSLLGATWSQQMLLFASMVPGGLEAEFSGLSTFCSSFLVWLPPLLMLALNEAFDSLRWGVAATTLLNLGGAALIHRVDVDRQLEKVAQSLEKRQFSKHVRAIKRAASSESAVAGAL